MKPYWNTLVVAGIDDGEPFLGTTDKLGVAFTEESIATGYGAYIALVCCRHVFYFEIPHAVLQAFDARCA